MGHYCIRFHCRGVHGEIKSTVSNKGVACEDGDQVNFNDKILYLHKK